MQRIHSSADAEITLRSVPRSRQSDEPKPHGLWYGFGDAWLQWCEAESFGDYHNGNHFAIVLHEDAALLRLTTSRAIKNFTDRYAADNQMRFRFLVDWRSVAQEFQGIEIVPYQWSCRLGGHTSWYYGWDCASGCIWNMKAIATIHRIAPQEIMNADRENARL